MPLVGPMFTGEIPYAPLSGGNFGALRCRQVLSGAGGKDMSFPILAMGERFGRSLLCSMGGPVTIGSKDLLRSMIMADNRLFYGDNLEALGYVLCG